ncbi:MAG: hypothetical protein IKN15_10470 [Bacteroidaceae bacterium]|nr:hypothetical protein [Bacteroidaceae bacterium]
MSYLYDGNLSDGVNKPLLCSEEDNYNNKESNNHNYEKSYYNHKEDNYSQENNNHDEEDDNHQSCRKACGQESPATKRTGSHSETTSAVTAADFGHQQEYQG